MEVTVKSADVHQETGQCHVKITMYKAERLLKHSVITCVGLSNVQYICNSRQHCGLIIMRT